MQYLAINKAQFMEKLLKSVKEFRTIENEWLDDNLTNFHRTISGIHDLCCNISEAERKSVDKQFILNEISDLRLIHSKSPFIKRLQEWPRGYMGDFETIEYLCENKNRVTNNNIEYFLEEYALKSNIAQQHRNKLNILSNYIIETIINKKRARILIVGCESGRNIRNIQNIIKSHDFNIIINDMDQNAISFIKENLNDDILTKCTFIPLNIIKLVKREMYNYEKFDLILLGGLFDYLNDKSIVCILENLHHFLTESGRMIFTNINKGNPFRIWIEYLANWKLIERSQEECLNLCIDSNIALNKIKTYKEETGLSNIIEINK